MTGLAGRACLFLILVLCPPASTFAGGGMVLEDDVCIIWIDFYSAHFTAYQPTTRGNEQFCQQLPDTGETLFVLDYLHQSLKEVPVDLRVIQNITGQGPYTKLHHVEQIENLESITVFYQPPVVRPNASFQVEFDLPEQGEYVGIVSAGHPTSDQTYTAVFPFEVGGSNTGVTVVISLLIAALLLLILHRRRRSAATGRGQEQ